LIEGCLKLGDEGIREICEWAVGRRGGGSREDDNNDSAVLGPAAQITKAASGRRERAVECRDAGVTKDVSVLGGFIPHLSEHA